MTVTVKRDATKPVVTYTGNAGAYTVDQTIDIHCAASDPSPGSGVESTTCESISGPAWSSARQPHVQRVRADVAGNVGTKATTFTIGVALSSLAAGEPLQHESRHRTCARREARGGGEGEERER